MNALQSGIDGRNGRELERENSIITHTHTVEVEHHGQSMVRPGPISEPESVSVSP